MTQFKNGMNIFLLAVFVFIVNDSNNIEIEKVAVVL